MQEKPNSWRLWDIAISTWYDVTGQLHLPLGPWLQPGSDLRRNWHSYYDHHEETVYSRTVDGFVQYSEDLYGYLPSEATTWQPTDTCIHIHLTPSTATHFGIRRTIPRINPPDIPTIPATFEQHVDSLPSWLGARSSTTSSL
jgi:hypothetical protein